MAERLGPRRPKPLRRELLQVEREIEEGISPDALRGEEGEIERKKRLVEDLKEVRKRLPNTGKSVDITI